MMHQQIRQENPRAEILEAMRMMDPKNQGFVPVSELRTKLTGFGERLTVQEGKSEPKLLQHTVCLFGFYFFSSVCVSQWMNF